MDHNFFEIFLNYPNFPTNYQTFLKILSCNTIWVSTQSQYFYSRILKISNLMLDLYA